MDSVSREQIDKLAEDIDFVKNAIKKNTSVLQQIDYKRSLRLVTLLTAFALFAFCGIFHLLLKHFGTFALIPVSIKAIFFCVLAFVLIVLGVMKNANVLKSARVVDPGISLWRLVREYYTFQIYHLFIPIAIVFVLSLFYAVHSGNIHLLIPILSLGAGIFLNCFATLLRLKEFLASGYWMIASGAMLLMLHTVDPLLGICLTIGGGLIVLSIALYLPGKNRMEA